MTGNELKLEDGTFRFLFASPARFVGECEGAGFYCVIAFQSWGRHSPLNKWRMDGSHFVLSIQTPPHDKKSIRVETYPWVGEELSALLGAYYGKLIVNLGHIQSGSNYMVPSEIKGPVGDSDRTPFNNEQRKPNGPQLNLSDGKRVIERYIETNGEEPAGMILRAAEFYRVALESFHSRPEIALAMFCSTLEALLPLRSYTEQELCDESLAMVIKQIEEYCPKGKRIVAGLKSRLHQIKRRVAAFVHHYVPDSYFEQIETPVLWSVPKNRADLISRIKNVYDLRSIVLHTGDRTGLSYLEHDHQRAETGLGFPVLGDAKLEKKLKGAFTLTGLERVTSVVLRAVIAEWVDTSEVGPTQEAPKAAASDTDSETSVTPCPPEGEVIEAILPSEPVSAESATQATAPPASDPS